MKMPRPPRRRPPNPFELPDVEAQAALWSACFSCDALEITPSVTVIARRARNLLVSQTAGLAAEAAAERIRCAMVAMFRRGALDIPRDVTGACTLHGDSLHPAAREYLGLLPLYRDDEHLSVSRFRQPGDA